MMRRDNNLGMRRGEDSFANANTLCLRMVLNEFHAKFLILHMVVPLVGFVGGMRSLTLNRLWKCFCAEVGFKSASWLPLAASAGSYNLRSTL